MREGYSLKDIDLPEFIEMITVLKHNGNRYIIFAKVKFYKKLIGLANKFNIDIIWDVPSIFS